MKRTRLSVLSLLLMMMSAYATPLVAGPLDVTQVAADATWLVHLDVDAMHDSTVVRRAYEKEIGSWPNVASTASAIVDQLCMNPAQDLRSVTAYGPTPGADKGVLLVHGSVDRAGMIDKLRQAPDYRTGSYHSFPVHSWTQADGNVTCGFFRDDVLVFSKTEKETTAALDVLEARSPGLVVGRSVLSESARAGTILLIRAIGLAEQRLPLKSPLVKNVRSLHVALGEHQGVSFSEARLVAESADAASQIREIAEGAIASAMLQYGEDPNAVKIIRSTRVKADENTLRIDTEVAADEVWAVIGTGWDRLLKK
jgi:hypothetical protein